MADPLAATATKFFDALRNWPVWLITALPSGLWGTYFAVGFPDGWNAYLVPTAALLSFIAVFKWLDIFYKSFTEYRKLANNDRGKLIINILKDQSIYCFREGTFFVEIIAQAYNQSAFLGVSLQGARILQPPHRELIEMILGVERDTYSGKQYIPRAVIEPSVTNNIRIRFAFRTDVNHITGTLGIVLSVTDSFSSKYKLKARLRPFEDTAK